MVNAKTGSFTPTFYLLLGRQASPCLTGFYNDKLLFIFKAHMMAPKDDEKKVNWFRAMDKDGNGEITMAEQIMTWEGLGAHEMANIDMIHPMTMKWDTDKDGKLNMDEYKQQP